MGKYKFKIGALLYLLALGLAGCELEQEVDLPEHEPKLTLRVSLANAAPDTVLYRGMNYSQLYIGRSQSVLDSHEDLDGVNNASVALYDEAGQVVEQYQATNRYYGDYYYSPEYSPQYKGYYVATKGFIPEPGKTYTLKASASNFETIEATATMPGYTAASGGKFTKLPPTYPNGYSIEGDLQITINDNLAERNYYRIIAYPVDSVYNRTSDYPAGSIIDYNNGPDLGEQEKLVLNRIFSDEIYSSGKISFVSKIQMPELDYQSFKAGKKRLTKFVEVQVQQVTKDEFLYVKSLEAQRRVSDNPFAEQINLHSNVRNGYGVLGGVTISKVVVPIE